MYFLVDNKGIIHDSFLTRRLVYRFAPVMAQHLNATVGIWDVCISDRDLALSLAGKHILQAFATTRATLIDGITKDLLWVRPGDMKGIKAMPTALVG